MAEDKVLGKGKKTRGQMTFMQKYHHKVRGEREREREREKERREGRGGNEGGRETEGER